MSNTSGLNTAPVGPKRIVDADKELCQLLREGDGTAIGAAAEEELALVVENLSGERAGTIGRHHGVAGPARQFLANVPDDLEATRHVIEGLADLLGDLAQGAAATGAGARCRM